MPSTSNSPYPPNNHQYPPSAPYAPHIPIPLNVHTTQPSVNTVIIQEQKLSSGKRFISVQIELECHLFGLIRFELQGFSHKVI